MYQAEIHNISAREILSNYRVPFHNCYSCKSFFCNCNSEAYAGGEFF